MPGEPATTSTADPHLFPPGPGRHQPADVGVLDHVDAVTADGQSDVDHPYVPASRAPSPWRSPGLAATKVTVAVAASTEPRRPGVAGHPRGDVDGQHRHARSHRGARRRRRGTPCRTRRRPPGRRRARRRRSARGRRGDDGHPGAASGQQAGRHPTVGTVVALAADDHHPAPVGRRPSGHGGPGHRRPGPGHQLVEGRDLGRPGVHLLHLGDGQDRLHVIPGRPRRPVGHHRGQGHQVGVGE